MSKPTRDDVIEAICSGFCDGLPKNHADLTPSHVVEAATDAVMALFEDKPKVKWEEMLDSLSIEKWSHTKYSRVCESNDAMDAATIEFKREAVQYIKDFIRETLREMLDDIRPDGFGTIDIRKKYGL